MNLKTMTMCDRRTYPKMHVHQAFRGQSTASSQKCPLAPLQIRSSLLFRIDRLDVFFETNCPIVEIALSQLKIRRKLNNHRWSSTWFKIRSAQVATQTIAMLKSFCFSRNSSFSPCSKCFVVGSLEWIHWEYKLHGFAVYLIAVQATRKERMREIQKNESRRNITALFDAGRWPLVSFSLRFFFFFFLMW